MAEGQEVGGRLAYINPSSALPLPCIAYYLGSPLTLHHLEPCTASYLGSPLTSDLLGSPWGSWRVDAPERLIDALC